MTDPQQQNKGHGHVVPRPDGVKARCGGPGLCKVCQQERRAISAPVQQQAMPPLPKVGPIGYASVVDIQSYAPFLKIGPHLPGVRDAALWTTDQMRAYATEAVVPIASALRSLIAAIDAAGYSTEFQSNLARAERALEGSAPSSAELEAAHAARREAQEENERLKARIASAGVEVRRDLMQQGWSAPSREMQENRKGDAVICSFCGTSSSDTRQKVIATKSGAICEGCHEIAGRVFRDAAPSPSVAPMTEERIREGFRANDEAWPFKDMTAWQVWNRAVLWVERVYRSCHSVAAEETKNA